MSTKRASLIVSVSSLLIAVVAAAAITLGPRGSATPSGWACGSRSVAGKYVQPAQPEMDLGLVISPASGKSYYVECADGSWQEVSRADYQRAKVH